MCFCAEIDEETTAMDKSESSLNHDTFDVVVTCHPVICDPGRMLHFNVMACIVKIIVAYVYR